MLQHGCGGLARGNTALVMQMQPSFFTVQFHEKTSSSSAAVLRWTRFLPKWSVDSGGGDILNGWMEYQITFEEEDVVLIDKKIHLPSLRNWLQCAQCADALKKDALQHSLYWPAESE